MGELAIDVPKSTIAFGSWNAGKTRAVAPSIAGNPIQTLLERAKKGFPSADHIALDEQGKKIHEQTLQVFGRLEKNDATWPLLTSYCETLEEGDMQPFLETLQTVKGAEQIAEVAKGNYIKQADRLLLGADAVLHDGHAIVSNFGHSSMFVSVEDIDTELQKIRADMVNARNVVEDTTSGHSEAHLPRLLSVLEKYMFDGSRMEEKRMGDMSLVVFHDHEDVASRARLEKDHIFHTKDRVIERELQGKRRQALLDKIDLCNKGDRETDNIFLSFPNIPDVAIIPLQDQAHLISAAWHHDDLQELWVDWYRLPYDKRPTVIMYSEGFTPELYQKHDYQGFLFCSTPDDLRSTLSLTKQIAKDRQSQVYKMDTLSPKQQEAYNNSDLREWETKTADTEQSLRHIFGRIQTRNALYEQWRTERSKKLFVKDMDGNTSFYDPPRNFIQPERPITTILDLGTGEGRIGGMLARAGYDVVGLDISEEQLGRAATRIQEEGAGLRHEKDTSGLSYHALEKLKKEGVISRELILDDEETAKKFQTVQGDFFNLQGVLNKMLVKWPEERPTVDQYAFFQETKYNQYAFADARDMFADVGFDVAMFNWHTFCETGSPENQKIVLEQILNVMWPGGELMLEIPDRTIEPYATALRTYHQQHPEEPYGTIRDPKPEGFTGLDGDTMYPPRYFPDVHELTLLLKSVGYEIDPKNDIQTYLIEDKNPVSQERTMTLKEHFITARKSRAK